MKKLITVVGLAVAVLLSGCNNNKQERADRAAVQQQQEQYAKSQPVPVYNWSLERHLVKELYDIRNMRAATHSVWRSNSGTVEGDCTSIGFGIPYDTSLTNPLQAYGSGQSMTSIEQAEPNGIFASKNTSATWVLCAGEHGQINPVYVESKVTVYPYPVDINYTTNRVKASGKASVSISTK